MIACVCGRYNVAPPLRKDGSLYSTKSYPNHPCTKWAGDSYFNYIWLYTLSHELCLEFHYRYGKAHAGKATLDNFDNTGVLAALPTIMRTPVPLCMPAELKHPTGDPVQSYRNCYNVAKKDIAFWNKNRPAPPWFNRGHVANFEAGEVL